MFDMLRLEHSIYHRKVPQVDMGPLGHLHSRDSPGRQWTKSRKEDVQNEAPGAGRKRQRVDTRIEGQPRNTAMEATGTGKISSRRWPRRGRPTGE